MLVKAVPFGLKLIVLRCLAASRFTQEATKRKWPLLAAEQFTDNS